MQDTVERTNPQARKNISKRDRSFNAGLDRCGSVEAMGLARERKQTLRHLHILTCRKKMQSDLKDARVISGLLVKDWISHRELAKRAKAHADTVKEAIRRGLKQVTLQLRQVFSKYRIMRASREGGTHLKVNQLSTAGPPCRGVPAATNKTSVSCNLRSTENRYAAMKQWRETLMNMRSISKKKPKGQLFNKPIWTNEQASELVKRYPDSFELWQRAVEYLDKCGDAGASGQWIWMCFDVLERVWEKTK